MTDRTSTQLYFIVGLVAALVLVPLVALAATTSPAAVQDGATFSATSGPEVTAGEDMNVATNNLFPNSETVRLGPTTVAHAGQLAVTLTGADTGLPTITPQASSSSDLTLAHDNTSLSATVTGGSVDSLALSDAAAIGDSTRDIEIDTGGTGTTLTVAGLTTSQVTFVDTSGSQNQELATKPVSSGTASLSVAANAQRDILLAPSGATFDVSLDSTNGPVVEGDNLTATATVNNTGGVQATQSITLDAGPLGTASTNLTLASGGSQTVTLSLPTAKGDAGTVTAQVSSDDDSASQGVDILRNVPIFELNITSSNAPIARGDTLSLEVLVKNAGAKSGTQTVTLTSGGAVLKSQNVTLASGGTQTLTFGVNSSTTPTGATATLASDNETVSFAAREDTWNRVNRFASRTGPVALSPTGERVAVEGGGGVEIYDTQTETLVETVTAPSSIPQALDWHPTDGELAIAAGQNLVVYDLEANTVIETVSYSSTLRDVEWSPDGERLLAGGYLYDADTFVQVRQENSANAEVAWSGDSQRFVIAGGRLDVYELGTAGDIFNVSQNTGPVRGLGFARDGAFVVSLQHKVRTDVRAATETDITVFDIQSGAQVDKIQKDQDFGTPRGASLTPAPDSNRLIATSGLVNPAIFAVSETGLIRLRTLENEEAGSTDWSANGDRVAFTLPGSSAEFRQDIRVYASNPVIKGQVTDAQGTPVENVTVDLAQGGAVRDSSPTGSNGRYTLVAPEPGDYTVTASFTGSSSAIIDSKEASVPKGGLTVPFTVERVDQGIAGRIVDSNGNPIVKSTVKIIGQSVIQNTTANGRFVLSTDASNIDLRGDAPDFRPETVTASVQTGSVANVTIQLEQQSGFGISGTVTDQNGDPIEGVDIFASSTVARTDGAGFYSLDVDDPGLVVVSATTAVDSKTQTVNATGGASNVDFTLTRGGGGGGGGGGDGGNITGNLKIRFENTGGIVNNRTVTVRFFDDSEELVATRNTSTGIVNLQTLGQPAPLVAVAEADGLFSRRVILDENGVRTLFLLDESKATGEVVVNEFEIRDRTGRFSGGDTRFIIKRAMPFPGETDDIPLRVLGSDLLGANERFGIALESDIRYRIQLVNDEGDVRDLGPHVVTSAGVVVLEIGKVTFEREDSGSFRVGADAVVTDPGGDGQPVTEITFSYDDPQRLTEQVNVRIYNRSNESQVILDQTFEPAANGSFGNLTVRKLVLGAGNASARWAVEYSIVRDDETREGEITVTGRSESLNIPMSQGLQQILGVGMIIVIGGLFSRRNAAVGAVIVPLLAGALFLVGALSGIVTGAAVAFALTLGVAYNYGTRAS